jgi:hypothetical protein
MKLERVHACAVGMRAAHELTDDALGPAHPRRRRRLPSGWTPRCGPAALSPQSRTCRHGSTRGCYSRHLRAGCSISTTSAAVGSASDRSLGVEQPARPSDMCSTYASNQLAAGIDPFELTEIMGTSMRMLEKHYGSVLRGAAASIARRQATFEAEEERAREERSEGDS